MGEEWAGTVRRLDPPRDVEVNVAAQLRPSLVGSGNTRLRVRAYGLYPGGWQPGQLLAWYQLSTADWYGLVTIDLMSSNRRVKLSLTALWPASALRPASRPESARNTESAK